MQVPSIVLKFLKLLGAYSHDADHYAKAANNQDLKPMLKLLQVLEKPYEKQKSINDYLSPAPASDKKYQTFCGT